ncbi:MAG: hypothetical protein U0936_01265 [Planctomycetaceae bacterium]
MRARIQKKPVWRVVCDMSPEQFASCVDFRYLTDALTKGQAIELLDNASWRKIMRIEELHAVGYPSYTTSASWLPVMSGEA